VPAGSSACGVPGTWSARPSAAALAPRGCSAGFAPMLATTGAPEKATRCRATRPATLARYAKQVPTQMYSADRPAYIFVLAGRMRVGCHHRATPANTRVPLNGSRAPRGASLAMNSSRTSLVHAAQVFRFVARRACPRAVYGTVLDLRLLGIVRQWPGAARAAHAFKVGRCFAKRGGREHSVYFHRRSREAFVALQHSARASQGPFSIRSVTLV
jgi:hypothetical protein